MPGVRLPAPGPQVSGSGIRKIAPEKEPAKAETAPQLEIELNDPVTVRDLAEEMGIKPWEVMSDLNEMNMSRGINEVLEPALAIRLARIRGFSLRLSS